MPHRALLLLATTVAWSIGFNGPSQAVDLGSFTGKTFDVPKASCHPHCKILGGGTLEGERYSFTDAFPSNVTLDPNTAEIQCLGGQECIFDQWGVTIDNVDHVAHIWVLSHSGSVKITWNAKLVSAEQPAQLPPASAVTPPPGLAATARDDQLKVITFIRENAVQICESAPLEGSDGGVKLSANASAKVSGIVSKLFSAGAEAKAESDKQNYIGVLQKDLPSIILNTNDCRMSVLTALLDKLFPAK